MQPTIRMKRGLTLVCKIMQNIANHVLFTKEVHMRTFNEFLRAHFDVGQRWAGRFGVILGFSFTPATTTPNNFQQQLPKTFNNNFQQASTKTPNNKILTTTLNNNLPRQLLQGDRLGLRSPGHFKPQPLVHKRRQHFGSAPLAVDQPGEDR